MSFQARRLSLRLLYGKRLCSRLTILQGAQQVVINGAPAHAYAVPMPMHMQVPVHAQVPGDYAYGHYQVDARLLWASEVAVSPLRGAENAKMVSPCRLLPVQQPQLSKMNFIVLPTT